MKSTLEQYRIPLSRLVAGLTLLALCKTESYWNTHLEIVADILFVIGIFLAAIGSLGRMWCSLYIAGYKDNQLVTKGPYSLCRNPLYLFSAFGALGIGFATKTLLFPLMFTILFTAYYPFVIKREESRLKQLFGSDYEEYTKTTPAFFPRLSHFAEPDDYSVKPKVYRKHIYSAIWFVWIIGLLELIHGLHGIGMFGRTWFIY